MRLNISRLRDTLSAKKVAIALRLCAALILTVGGGKALAQPVLQGKVIDAATSQAIPFVHIVTGTPTPFGGVSNIDGVYRIGLPGQLAPGTPVTLTCIGYEQVTLPFSEFSTTNRVEMTPKAAELSEVVIEAKEDPGYEIIRRAAANRRVNNPENLSGFKLSSYNKAGLDVERIAEVQQELDSTGFANARFFMLESKTDLVYKKPGKWNETVVATQVSGINNPQFAIISNSFQPFSTYTDHINLLETDWLNPISPGSENRYVFELVDSAQVDGQKVYIVAFQPRAKVKGNYLRGSVTIGSEDYAIVNLRAANSNPFNLMDFEIRQNYGRVEGKWFPKESKTQYTIYLEDPDDKDNPLPMMLYSTTYLKDIDVTYQPAGRDFNVAQVTIAKGAGQIDRDAWAELRPFELDSNELNTYAVFDTLPPGVLNTMNWFMNQSTALAAGRLRFGKVDLMLHHLLRLNQFEGLRLGAGLSTNENFIRWVSFEGYFAYGFRDKRTKYGGGAVFHISRKRAIDLAFRYRNDVSEPGRGNFDRDFSFVRQGFALRNFFASTMNPVEQYTAELTMRPARGFKTDFSFMRERRTLIATEELGEQIFPTTDIILAQWRAALQWVPGESLMQLGNVMIPTGTDYPRFRLAASGGLPEVLDGSQDFVRADFEFSHSMRLRRLGRLQLHGGAGRLWGSDIAFPYLNFGRGSNGFEGPVGLETPGFFQTMLLYDFLMDEYAYIGMQHHFGTVFGIEGKFSKPSLKMAYNAGIGNLSSGNTPGDFNLTYRQMNKPYLEAGLIIDDIFRFKTNGGTTYNGFGFGAFMLHGHYAASSLADNLTFVVSITNSF